jgi:YVTN family beta-propeller protein
MRRLSRVSMAVSALAVTFVGGALAAVMTPAAAASGPYQAFIVNSAWNCPGTSNSVTEVDGSGSTWTPSLPLYFGNPCVSGQVGIAGIATSPNGATAYLAQYYDSQIAPINTSTFTDGTSFSSGGTGPFQDAVTPNGDDLLVPNNGNDTLAVISTSNPSDVHTVSTGSQPFDVAVLPDGSAAYVTNNAGNTVTVVNLVGTPTVSATISFPGGGCVSPLYASATPNGKAVYVTCNGGSELWKISVAKNKAAKKGIALPHSGPTTLATGPGNSTMYVTDGGSVYPVDLTTGSPGKAIKTVSGVFAIASSPDAKYLLAASYNNPVYVVSTATNKVVSSFSSGGGGIFSIAFNN